MCHQNHGNQSPSFSEPHTQHLQFAEVITLSPLIVIIEKRTEMSLAEENYLTYLLFLYINLNPGNYGLF